MVTEINKLVSVNKKHINNTLAILCVKENPSLIQAIMEDNTVNFNHPSIISYFNYPSEDKPMRFPQLFAGYSGHKLDGLELVSDTNGIVYLPKIGMFKTEFSCEEMSLSQSANGLKLKRKNRELTSQLIKTKYLHNSIIELLPEMPELYYPNFQQTYRGHIVNENPSFNAKNPSSYVSNALKLIEKYFPTFYNDLVLTTSLLFVHDNSQVLNYISFNNHGAIFLYMLDEHDEVYFIEEIIHQGTHNLLNTLCFEKSLFFKIDVENIQISEYIDKPTDYRDIFSVIHGLASISKRVEGLEKMLNAPELSDKQKHELHGRLSDQFERFHGLGYHLLNKEAVLTALGLEYFDTMYRTCATSIERLQWLNQLDMSWIDLDFRYAEFVRHNPIENFLAFT